MQAIATEFPHTPHRYCQNHFRRDVATPVLELDRRAKVKRRRKVRGLRAIERCVLEDRRHSAALEPASPPEPLQADATPLADRLEAAAPEACTGGDVGGVPTDSVLDAMGLAVRGEAGGEDEAGAVVLGYCAAVRGILNGLLLDSGVLADQELNERTQQRFASLADVVDKREEPEVEREFLLRNAPMRAPPTPQQRPVTVDGEITPSTSAPTPCVPCAWHTAPP